MIKYKGWCRKRRTQVPALLWSDQIAPALTNGNVHLGQHLPITKLLQILFSPDDDRRTSLTLSLYITEVGSVLRCQPYSNYHRKGVSCKEIQDPNFDTESLRYSIYDLSTMSECLPYCCWSRKLGHQGSQQRLMDYINIVPKTRAKLRILIGPILFRVCDVSHTGKNLGNVCRSWRWYDLAKTGRFLNALSPVGYDNVFPTRAPQAKHSVFPPIPLDEIQA